MAGDWITIPDALLGAAVAALDEAGTAPEVAGQLTDHQRAARLPGYVPPANRLYVDAHYLRHAGQGGEDWSEAGVFGPVTDLATAENIVTKLAARIDVLSAIVRDPDEDVLLEAARVLLRVDPRDIDLPAVEAGDLLSRVRSVLGADHAR